MVFWVYNWKGYYGGWGMARIFISDIQNCWHNFSMNTHAMVFDITNTHMSHIARFFEIELAIAS